MTSVRAIETRYAGCHFRSRLEARWAVFFDHLGIAWEYEPQGFELPSGRYLPDFWLPKSEVWVEVKGHEPNEADVEKLVNLASQVSPMRHRCRLLGPIPRRTMTLVDFGLEGGAALGSGVFCYIPTPEYLVVTGLDEGVSPPTIGEHGDLQVDIASYSQTPSDYWTLMPTVWIPGFNDNAIKGALDAARSARFEHGHSGAS